MSRLRKVRAHVLVCEHKTCARQGAKKSLKVLKRTLKGAASGRGVLVTKVDCLDQCGRGPVMVVYPEGVWLGSVGEDGARAVAGLLAAGDVLRGGEAAAGAGDLDGCKVLHDMRAGGEGN